MLTTMAYVSFQELATRISHRNTGRHTDDEGCDRLLARIAADENLHMLFYRNVFAAAFELSPDAAMEAVRRVVGELPDAGQRGRGLHPSLASRSRMAGIYDLRIHHDEVLAPVLRAWDVWDRTDLGPEGEAARERLAAYLAGVDAAATRFEQKRAEKAARLLARATD